MAQLPDHIANEVGKARVAGGGNFINHGSYMFMFDKAFYQKIQDECIIYEHFVIESRKKTVYEGEKLVEQEPNAVGSNCSDVANFSGNSKLSAGANSRAPLIALFGFKENEVPDQKVKETLNYILSDAQTARGMLVACSTYPKEIRSNKGNYITGRAYEHVAKPGEGLNAPDMVKARLDALLISPEECVRVTLDQLTKARAAGTAPAISASVAPAAPNGASNGAHSVPSLPTAPPDVPTVPPSDPFAGWTVHPKNPEFYYKGKEIKSKADLLAGK